MVWLFWLTGVEPIYGHLAPFYALLFPAFEYVSTPLAFVSILVAVWTWRLGHKKIAALPLLLALVSLLLEIFLRENGDILRAWQELRWQILCAAVVLLGFAALSRMLHILSDTDEPDRGTVGRVLVGLVLWAFVFPAVVAMLRDGANGISMAYSRGALEYISDIGRTPSIRALFERYTEIHPYLSMHAKVHPPGPIAMLWLMSFAVFSQDALPLSIATMAFGALGALPMYAWARELTGNVRTALVCTTLYTLMPTVVLFSATSADILFMPFTLATLWLFTRALNRGSIGAALGAGLLYGVLALFSFSLLSLGAYFACMGIQRMREDSGLPVVFRTAAIMIVCAVAVHVGVYFWSGYDTIEVFKLSKRQFDTDQMHLDELDPRYASWTFKFFNPMAWFWFAGIPVSVLAVLRILRPADRRGTWWGFAITLLALAALYLGRGEGERSAMYVMPFIALPAGHLLAQRMKEAADARLMTVTATFLIFQAWATECWLYTYW